jgi:hypothetical protein
MIWESNRKKLRTANWGEVSVSVSVSVSLAKPDQRLFGRFRHRRSRAWLSATWASDLGNILPSHDPFHLADDSFTHCHFLRGQAPCFPVFQSRIHIERQLPITGLLAICRLRLRYSSRRSDLRLCSCSLPRVSRMPSSLDISTDKAASRAVDLS